MIVLALDGIFLHSITEELRNTILDCKVDKINQPEKDEIYLSFRGKNKNFKLLISSSAVYAKIHLTDINKPNPLKAPVFCMVLRKYLLNAKINNITQLDLDRVIMFDFESSDEMGFHSIYSLIVEIMGRHSNITLVRQRDSLIMDSIKHITPDINSYRSLYSGIKYIFPPKSQKLSPFNFSLEDLKVLINTNRINYDKNIFSKIFTGLGPQLSKEFIYRLSKENISLNEDNLNDKNLTIIYELITSIFLKIKNNSFYFVSYFHNEAVKEFYCFKLTGLDGFNEHIYTSPSVLLQEFYYEKDKYDRLNSRSSNLQKIVHTNLDRCFKKIDILNNTLKDCSGKGAYRIQGELLTANIYAFKKGATEYKALNYYCVDEEYITIKLDENRTPSENIQFYYKKYNKFKRAEQMADVQLKLATEEINYLSSVLTNIKNADNYEEIEESRLELIETGYMKFKKGFIKKKKISKPLHFISSDGIHIYVGKNNMQNDYLTLKLADKHDIWMHTKDIPGSHVIIKNFGDTPAKTLEEAAILAAYYSKGKESSKVPVDYTEVRNVKKPSGSKPGMVIYYTNKTLYVNPSKLELKKIE